MLESLWQISGLTARVDELVARNKALLVCIAELEAEHGKPPKNAGLFATAVARSEGERRGADAGKPDVRARRGLSQSARHLRRALRVRRPARRGRPGTREGLGPCRSAARSSRLQPG